MVKFSLSESILHPDSVFLVYTTKDNIQPRRVKVPKRNINNLKNKIVRDEVLRILTDLAKQRENVFIHSGYATDTKTIQSLESIKRQLVQLAGIYNMKDYFAKVIHMTLPFEGIAPSAHSRYVNWKPLFNDVCNFALKCHEYYSNMEANETPQTSMNQQFINTNSQNPVGAGT